jgi:hypothetical protein
MLLFKYDWPLSLDFWIWLLILAGIVALYFFNSWSARKKKAFSASETNSQTGDDLTQIAGVSAAVQEALQAAGIATFARLAQTSAGELRHLLQKAGLPSIDPETWSEQARLAASGDWQALADWKEKNLQ